MSGKSTMARLLKDYVRRTSPNTRVYAFSWLSREFLEEHGVNGFRYHQLLNIHLQRPIDTDDWLRMRNMLLIIDRAQMSYRYNSFWTDFIKTVAISGDESRRVILFSSYGSPTENPVMHGGPGSPPMVLSANQRVSIRSLSDNNREVALYFTRLEFDDVVTRVCKGASKDGQPFCPSPELLDYVWEFSNGHPGATRAVLDALINSKVSVHSFYYRLHFNLVL
jgi:hypothetical protein